MRLMYWIHRKTDLARTGLIVLVTALLSLGAHTPSEAQKLNSALPTDGQVIRSATHRGFVDEIKRSIG